MKSPKKKKGVKEPRFKTYEEIVEDGFFQSSVMRHFDALLRKRNSRKTAAKGRKYKRDWYDRMIAANQLTKLFFLENVLDVLNETSTLSSSSRKVVRHVAGKAVNETLEHYKTMDN